tara:strand:- start:3239 stop:3709 length:471 start_codon:yes stop_codon:yes gene_type:complete
MRIFWAQNEKPSIPDTLIDENGKIYKLGDEDYEGSSLFNKLLDYQTITKTVYQSGNLVIKRHLNKGFFISSNFSDKDDIGRPMAFMFYTENNTKESIISDLLFFSKLIKRTITNEDNRNIETEILKATKENNKKIVKLIAVIITALIIYMLWKKIS